jgi:hypothetical protein
MKNKLLLVLSLATALSAMTAGAIITPLTPVLDKSQYQAITRESNNSLAGNLNLLNSLINPDQSSVGASYDGPNSSFTFLPVWHYAVLLVQSAGSPAILAGV